MRNSIYPIIRLLIKNSFEYYQATYFQQNPKIQIIINNYQTYIWNLELYFCETKFPSFSVKHEIIF
ncbi:unnamed protein product [Paramecium octaurelia]|uniref:Uncharacterized protein n=1 Tax=Paramecium octaurelia TaxID=43137 RepID=A0A8S1VI83_PAROT|nr:unnamed protein product [Paramecium octaurelia]